MWDGYDIDNIGTEPVIRIGDYIIYGYGPDSG